MYYIIFVYLYNSNHSQIIAKTICVLQDLYSTFNVLCTLVLLLLITFSSHI